MNAPIALITGGSRGLGRAIAGALAERGWRVVLDGRDPAQLERATRGLGLRVTAVPGDVSDPGHRRDLKRVLAALGGLDLLVNNASTLGASPQPALASYPLDVLRQVYETNTIAPLALIQELLPLLDKRRGRIVNVSSDAAVEPYEGWGGYGSSKAALDQLTAILAAEHPGLGIYGFDPGDMNTDLHQQAFPGEDISDRPSPASVVPALLRLIEGDLPPGRYRAAALLAEATVPVAAAVVADGLPA